jgi:hypothetical protein
MKFRPEQGLTVIGKKIRLKQNDHASRRTQRSPHTRREQHPRYYLHSPIIGVLASQARHDSRPQSPMIRGVLSPGLVGGW